MNIMGRKETRRSVMNLAAMEGEIAVLIITTMMVIITGAYAGDTNPVYSPCEDAKVEIFDGFTLGLVFSSKDSFFLNQIQLSPCDNRLPLASSDAEFAIFRPKVDEITLLTLNSTSFNPRKSGGYMVAFAGKQFAARSIPVFLADDSHTVSSFTLVLEFKTGKLENLFWKKFGCSSCSGGSFVCLDNTDCAIPNSVCKKNGGSVKCNVGIQLAFSGTDKNDNVLNSWYEVDKLRQYSLFGLYADLRDSLTGSFSGLF